MGIRLASITQKIKIMKIIIFNLKIQCNKLKSKYKQTFRVELNDLILCIDVFKI